MPHTSTSEPSTDQEQKKRELMGFLLLAVLLAPVLSVLLVGGYGFLVWIVQIIAGPPGPPGA
ncbi:MAG: periplasmic nitrate reductase, NapE protein [Candidatus Competibacterales bacterium]|nr:periplasmic nitrate reductase, NapE protein [Candidatus Competibacterales bacterium]